MITTSPPPYPSRAHHSQSHVRRNPPTSTSLSIITRLLRRRINSSHLVLRQRLLPSKILVDNTTHTHLAVVPYSLAAVVPKGLCVLDYETKHVFCFAFLCREVEAGEDAIAHNGGGGGEWLTRRVEGGLHDGVVLGHEVEFYDVADSGGDVFGLKVEAVEAGGYAVDDACGADVLGWDGGGEADEGGCYDSEECEGDHDE